MNIPDEVLLRYVAGTASDDEIWRVDTELARDPEFLDHVRRVFVLQRDFDPNWNSFLASLPRYPSIPSSTASPDLDAIIEQIITTHRVEPERLRGWAGRASAQRIPSFRLLIDRIHALTALAPALLPSGCSSQVRFQFGGIGLHDQAIEHGLREGSDRLARKDLAGCRESLEAVARIDPSQSRTSQLEALSANGSAIELISNGTHGQLVLRWKPPAPGIHPPVLCLLVSETDPEWFTAAESEFLPEDDVHVYEFTSIPNGSIHIFLVE